MNSWTAEMKCKRVMHVVAHCLHTTSARNFATTYEDTAVQRIGLANVALPRSALTVDWLMQRMDKVVCYFICCALSSECFLKS